MLQLFSFIIMWLGSLNWFFISAFQYDFVAGFFGTQSSLFSRIIYFAIGMAGFVMVFHAIKGRGKINLIERPFIKKTTKVESQPKQTVEEAITYEEVDPEIYHNTKPSPYQKKAEVGYKDFDPSKYDD